LIGITGLSGNITPGMRLGGNIRYPDGLQASLPLILRIDTADEIAYFRNGGILPYVLRKLLAATSGES
jgi:aconitate hydratase